MVYTWRCEQCGADTEVSRAIKDIDKGPDDGCGGCGHPRLVRVIVRNPDTKGFILNGAGWYHDGYSKPAPKTRR